MTKVHNVHVWECKVALKTHDSTQQPYSAQPTVMQGEFANYLQARAYFSHFGKMLSEPRIIR